MALALEHADIPVKQMAAELGLHPATVSRWLSGKKQPSRAQVISWAMRCNVSVVWLVTGKAEPDPEHPAARWDEARWGDARWTDEEEPVSTIWYHTGCLVAA